MEKMDRSRFAASPILTKYEVIVLYFSALSRSELSGYSVLTMTVSVKY